MIVGLGLIAPFFIYILSGVIAQILLRHGADQQRWLDAFVFYLALPALLFQSVRTVPPGAESLVGFLAVTTTMTGMMFVIGWFIGRGNQAGAHPFILATIAALLFASTGWSLPKFIDTPLTGFQHAAAPAALFSLGLTLARNRGGHVETRLGACLAVKLIIHPLAVALAFMLVSGFDPIWVATAIIMGALPPAANVYVMARAEGISVALSARAVLYGTLFSAVTLPVVISLVA